MGGWMHLISIRLARFFIHFSSLSGLFVVFWLVGCLRWNECVRLRARSFCVCLPVYLGCLSVLSVWLFFASLAPCWRCPVNGPPRGVGLDNNIRRSDIFFFRSIVILRSIGTGRGVRVLLPKVALHIVRRSSVPTPARGTTNDWLLLQ